MICLTLVIYVLLIMNIIMFKNISLKLEKGTFL